MPGDGDESSSLLLAVAALVVIGRRSESSAAPDAAASVGDDVLMAQAGQTVNPDNCPQGSAEERASWLLRGFNTGSPDSCDTFAAA